MFIFNKFLILWCVFSSIKSVYMQSCDYVKNLSVSFQDGNSTDWKQTTVNGCIDSAALGSSDVKRLDIRCSNTQLNQIGPKFVNNLPSLEGLSISDCKFETVEPGAFVNIPKLIDLSIGSTSLQEIRKGLMDGFSSLTNIYLYLNQISYVEDNAFANLPNLRFIGLNGNRFEYIRREWFSNTTGIKTFYMSQNALRQIPPRMFEGWSNLEFVTFFENKISVIHEGAFRNISPIITIIDLHLNGLTNISPKIFSDGVHIEVLRISANLLNYISEEFLKNVDVKYLYIHGNPFKCPCLERLQWVLHEKKGVIVNNPADPYFYMPCYLPDAPVCVVPKRFRYCQDTVDTEATRNYLMYLKKIGYDSLRGLDAQCANFDALTL